MFCKRALTLIFFHAIAFAAAKDAFCQAGQKSSPETASAAVARPKLFDVTAIDTSADPCEDFDQYACGKWRKENPVPADKVFWARYNQLVEYNRQVLRKILEDAAVVRPDRTQAAKVAGDFYASCMNEAAANRQGARSLRRELKRLAAISSRKQLLEAAAHLHRIGVPVLFEFGAQPDLHDAAMQIAVIMQGGLGLPDRDYYLDQSDNAKQTRARYLKHMSAMLVLLGDGPDSARKEAEAVLAIETRLAQASFERARMRSPEVRDHKVPIAALGKLAPHIPFRAFFAAAGAPALAEVNVAPPEFVQKLDQAIVSVPLDDWKAYLKWHLVQANAGFLSSAFVKEDFEFERRYLNGQREIEPRWKRCVSATDRLAGDALGRLYVEQVFSPESRQRTLAMVKLEEQTLAEDIQELPWMTAQTKQQAILKLHAITNKIGFPGKWLDYKSVAIKRGELATNVAHLRAFEFSRDLAKIGHPVDKDEWVTTTPTVNAYYYPPENSIYFPAGVLQPPLFNPHMDDAVNFGAIGWLIGHELTHGFDDQGSKFDGEGNLKNWWTPSDRREFEKRTSCIADQYQKFVVVDDLHLNGRLTLGENTADNGGIRIAFAAFHKADSGRSAAKNRIDGFTPDQRFFISFAQQWCANVTPERLRIEAKVDPHSPVRIRTLGTLRNDPDFARAFGCKATQKMVSKKPCRVW